MTYQESVAGSVIQATGTVEFEDGLWIGNHLKARNGLQRVRTIPGVRPGAVRTPGFLRGQTEFQSAWVRVAAWWRARRRVRISAAAVLGLTRPREVGTFVLFPDVRQNPLWDTHFLPLGRRPYKQNKQTKHLLYFSTSVSRFDLPWLFLGLTYPSYF